MIPRLLVYCCAAEIFSSHQIELATCEHVAVRLITGNTCPDHDTICTFRRETRALLESDVTVIELAAELKGSKAGN